MPADLPLVSCIMPTNNRREFVPLAIRYFQRQDYPHRELIVMDDGSDAVEDLIPEDPAIRYVRLPKRLSLGAKRNRACELSAGGIIAHWDDDDWMAATRLTYQVGELRRAGARLCGLANPYFLDLANDRAWQYRYRGKRPWVAGGTMLYERRVWEARPFDAVNDGEDTRFVWRLDGQHVLALSDPSIYVALIHGRNSSRKRTSGQRWQSRSAGSVRAMLGEDGEAYSGLSSNALRDSSARTHTERVASDSLLDDPRVPWSDWSVSPALARTLAAHLEEDRPARVLELGSGVSTLVLARYAARHEAAVTVLEHDPTFLNRTAELLSAFGLREAVDLRLAPLIGRAGARWYDTPLEGPFNFVFADGPPLQEGRGHILPAVHSHLTEPWTLWLKDGRRTHERSAVARWEKQFSFGAKLRDWDPRGVWELSAGPTGARSHDREPLVSCLMPTYDRRPFVAQALRYFLRQDYSNSELIIVDDGTDAVEDLMPDDPRIRYLRLGSRGTTGAKRNRAAEAARGEILVCWDDDDWHGPGRIRAQVQPILRSEADVTALGRSPFFCVASGRFWRCTAHVHARMFYQSVVGGTMAFRRSLWQAGARFPNTSMAEDAMFLRTLLRRGARLASLPNRDLFVYVRHDANSWHFQEGRHLDRSGWRVMERPKWWPEADRAFYHDLRPTEPV